MYENAYENAHEQARKQMRDVEMILGPSNNARDRSTRDAENAKESGPATLCLMPRNSKQRPLAVALASTNGYNLLFDGRGVEQSGSSSGS